LGRDTRWEERGFVSNDLKTVRDFVVDGTGIPADFGTPPTTTDWTSISFRSNVSRTRAFILALAAVHPRNLTNGAAIDPSQALSALNKKQFHHIFPRAYLKRIGAGTTDNLVANICMIAAAGNNAVSDADPAEYLPRCATTLGDRADSVFHSNLMPAPSAFDYSKASYDQFLAARIRLISEVVQRLCNGEHPA
jgi:hypothetical protein